MLLTLSVVTVTGTALPHHETAGRRWHYPSADCQAPDIVLDRSALTLPHLLTVVAGMQTLLWLPRVVVACALVGGAKKGDKAGCQLLLYPRYHLDNSSLLARYPLVQVRLHAASLRCLSVPAAHVDVQKGQQSAMPAALARSQPCAGASPGWLPGVGQAVACKAAKA